MYTFELPAELIRQAETHQVFLREFWSDDWAEEPHLFCNSFTFTASPTISSAEFEWRYGVGRRQADEGFDQVDRLDRTGWWIRVDVQMAEGDDVVWVGLIVEDGDNPHGSLDGSTTGVQKLLAYGPEILLERQTIGTSFFEDDGDEKRILRGLTFNDVNHVRPSGGVDKKAHDDRAGNRSAERTAGNCYLFAGDPATAGSWSSLDIADYLLGYQVPRDSDFEQAVPIFLDGETSALYLPDWDKPVLRQHGRTLRDVLGELMDRRRMLGYTIRYDTAGDYFRLYPFSYADDDIDLGDGKVFHANIDYLDLVFDSAVDVVECNIKESDAHRYDQVIATGARIICCGTIAGVDHTLEKHWTDTHAEQYNTAASGAADYEELEQFNRDDRNKAIRASEELRRVYSYFGLPADWWGIVGDGENIMATVPLLDESLVDFTDMDVAWYPGELRLLDRLPLKTDHDYSGYLIANDTVADNTPPGQAWHYRDTFVLLKLPPGPDGTPRSGGTRYADVTKLSHACDAEIFGDGNGVNFCCSVRPQPDGPGIVLRVHGGIGQHEIAGSEFVPIDPLTDPAGTFDWQNNLIVTFAMEADCHVEVKYPATLPAGLDAACILRIDASRSAANPEAVAGLHYVAPGTVVGLNDGQLVRTTTGGLVRDDRKLLERIARAAYEWYGRRRQAMTLSYRQICNQLTVGQLIVHIGDGESLEPIRTVITEIRIELAQQEGATHRTTIQTQWAELDVLKLL